MEKVLEYFSQLYSTGPAVNQSFDGLEFPMLSHSEKHLLNRPVTQREIETVLFHMGPDKAPGPDETPPAFYQKNWEVVRSSVIMFVMEYFRVKHFPVDLNETILTLIPKVNHPDSITQFQPTALTNVVVKLISKVIANRLKLVIHKLVAQEQCTFTSRRTSSENIIVARD